MELSCWWVELSRAALHLLGRVPGEVEKGAHSDWLVREIADH